MYCGDYWEAHAETVDARGLHLEEHLRRPLRRPGFRHGRRDQLHSCHGRRDQLHSCQELYFVSAFIDFVSALIDFDGGQADEILAYPELDFDAGHVDRVIPEAGTDALDDGKYRVHQRESSRR